MISLFVYFRPEILETTNKTISQKFEQTPWQRGLIDDTLGVPSIFMYVSLQNHADDGSDLPGWLAALKEEEGNILTITYNPWASTSCESAEKIIKRLGFGDLLQYFDKEVVPENSVK